MSVNEVVAQRSQSTEEKAKFASVALKNMDDFDLSFLDDIVNTTDLEFVSELGTPHKISLVFYGLVFLLGTPGNALVAWVTACRMPQSVNSQYFLQLALADLLCCLSLPFLMVPLAMDQHWPYGELGCKLLTGIFSLTMYCSVLLLVLISLDRWLLVSRPVWCQNKRRPERARMVCMMVWGLALIFSIPTFVYMQEEKRGTNKVECKAKHTSLVSAWMLVCVRFILGFLLPFLAIVLCHWAVYTRAVQSQPAGTNARTQRTRRVILAVVLSFFLCWLPLNIVDFLALVTPINAPYLHRVQLAHVMTICLAYSNSCLNPLLYVCLGRGFKDSLRQSLRGILSFLSEEPHHRQSMSYTKSTDDNIQERGV
ncbi:hypothetical protein AGOR_G00126940 [Albula goreensis]|uniref:G-protein coupled receptors family 1 profile domain-containing protein n=1 Tax=Albula goreensis TaxID=1534307 RepID=A0A8T3DH77_9TELE|nr:hypothetical protein AGOR_G00126940 [Albula goreensis]